KIKRQKHVKKTLKFYKTHFGIGPPFKILIDGTFCKVALHFQINIFEQMPKYLDCDVHLSTTNCALAECSTFGFRHDLPLYGVYKVISQYSVVECGHKNPLSPSECLLRMAKKNVGYFVATQDQKLSASVRSLHAVPLLYISHKSINLEAPSLPSKHLAQQKEIVKFNLSEQEQKQLNDFKEATIDKDAIKPKRKKIKGPNPLSCKKKKAKPVDVNGINKRHRKRKR
ncbi:hypothetical protein HELRODRAFT_133549, partial [Helobdella robusta]|uniref:rRNA-processing protein UTP23 homolog n=1 Tax=Helobdella robusta TaxID=6412 RepID=T1EI13_HELRO